MIAEVYSSCVMTYPTRFLAKVVDGAAVDALRERSVPFGGAAPDGTWLVVREIDGAAHAVGEPVARPDTALADLVALAVDHGLDPVFSDAVEREALAWTEDPRTDEPSLTDLRHLPFVTIDNVDSRDLDQALLVERAGRGHRVRYAIADASFYVPRGSALFAEALRRGASYYLPGWMIPMLPRALSEGIVSLNPRVDRRALVFDMQLDASGACTSTDVVPARIRSRAKLAYDGVQRFLDDEDPELRISARRLDHTIECFGYRVDEVIDTGRPAIWSKNSNSPVKAPEPRSNAWAATSLSVSPTPGGSGWR